METGVKIFILASLVQEINNEIFWLINDLVNRDIRFIFHKWLFIN